MLCWRLVAIFILFVSGLVVLSLTDDANAQAFEFRQPDSVAGIFEGCVERLQLEIDLGIKPDMTQEQAFVKCVKTTESVVEQLREQGLDDAPDFIAVVPAF